MIGGLSETFVCTDCHSKVGSGNTDQEFWARNSGNYQIDALNSQAKSLLSYLHKWLLFNQLRALTQEITSN